MSAHARWRLGVVGTVQGVGFRPFVHRLATELGLSGFVRNETSRVLIEVEGPTPSLQRFRRNLADDLPPMARVDEVTTEELRPTRRPGFVIASSDPATTAAPAAPVPADRAICDDCVAELFDPTDRRFGHPFITCVNCGPRFTIIDRLPYDRPNTSMAAFEMCAECTAEHSEHSGRRHHDQALACHRCGPTLRRVRRGESTVFGGAAITGVRRDLASGQVVAIKGIGGYHLAVDASDDRAVETLRRRKGRPEKPFAVMVGDVAAARTLAHLDETEAAALESPARPIVLVRRRHDAPVAPGVAPGSPLLGVMLAYTPLHHLLFARVPRHDTRAPRVLVMTSANLGGEPICHADEDEHTVLAMLADSTCTHDRPILVPCDDSVVRVMDGRVVPFRRGRGYAPEPLRLPVEVPPGLAVGADLKAACCHVSGRRAWLSQHVGDLGHLRTLQAMDACIDHLSSLSGVEAETVAVDAHPGYLSRRLGHARGDPVEIQHHHAHAASLMAEAGHSGAAPIIAFVFDGTGYGADRSPWGGEVLLADYQHAERWGHLENVQLPGGDAAVANPCRTALAHLSAAGLPWDADLAPVTACEDAERAVLARQLSTGMGCVATSSMGRLFDAVASLLDLRHRITYEAQAAIDLEALAATHRGPVPSICFGPGANGGFDAAPVLAALVEGLRAGLEPSALAAAFHEAVVEAMLRAARRIRADRSLEVVGLTGGVFQNAVLTGLATRRLAGEGFEVLNHRLVPPNDGGLALGQAVIAGCAAQRARPSVWGMATCV